MTMPHYSINGDKIEIDSSDKGNISFDFGRPIAQVLPVKSAFVVRTESDLGSCENRNVCAIGRGGDIIWRVRYRKHVYDDSPYTSIEIKAGKILLSNWDGLTVVVNAETFIEESEYYGR